MEIESIYGDLPRLETERLILRKISIDDSDDMYNYGSNQDVSRYVTWNRHESKGETQDFIEYVVSKYDNRKVAPWGIEFKDNGKFIGTVDYVWWEPAHKTAEIGYVLSQDYWGKGLMPEAVNEILSFGFQKMELVRVQAKCFVENTASERVMEKVGMTYEGTLRKSAFIKGKHQDLKVYSILKEEFDR